MIKTFQQYQSFANQTAIYPNRGSNLYYPALGLGEVGEIDSVEITTKNGFWDNFKKQRYFH